MIPLVRFDQPVSDLYQGWIEVIGLPSRVGRGRSCKAANFVGWPCPLLTTLAISITYRRKIPDIDRVNLLIALTTNNLRGTSRNGKPLKRQIGHSKTELIVHRFP